MLQAIQPAVLGADGGVHVADGFRRADSHNAWRVGQVRSGHNNRQLHHPAGRSKPLAQRIPLHHRLSDPVPGDRRVLRAHLLHRAQNGGQISRAQPQERQQHAGTFRRRQRQRPTEHARLPLHDGGHL